MAYNVRMRHCNRPTAILRLLLVVISVAALCAPVPSTAISSNNYSITEDFIGGGGAVDASSDHYSAQDSMGDNIAGESNGTAFSAAAGLHSSQEPRMDFSVDADTVALGSLSTSVTRTGTATFSVLNYTSYGYNVYIIGDPPNNGAHTLTAMTTAAAASTNTEQFGINLAANTAPATFGAAPQQIPDTTFSFGAAASGYNTTNLYKFVPGDIIATAPKSSGKTTYTISYIANIGFGTPGGSYSSSQTLVAVGTY